MMRGSRIGAGLIGLLALLALSAPAEGAPRVAGAFDVSSLGASNEITQGPDGNMWVTLDDVANNVARIRPNGNVTEFNLPGVTFPVGIATAANAVWVTQGGGVARIPPNNPAATQTFPIAAIGDPRGLTRAPDGNLWAASDDQVIRIPPSNPAGFQAFTIPNLSARAITASRNRISVADFGDGRVISVAFNGTIQETHDVGGNPQGVAAGPNGQLGYTNAGSDPNVVGRITRQGAILNTLTPGADPFGIAIGTDGAYWTAEFNGSRAGRLAPQGGYRRLQLPDSGPRQLAPGPRNTLWVTLDNSDKVARVRGVDPQTKITKGPKGTVKAKGSKTRVKFQFRSPGVPGLSFQCALKGPGKKPKFRRCKSPKTYKLAPGSYRFSVRAKGIGRPDPSPAKRKFTIAR